jgi:hypothetical protein
VPANGTSPPGVKIRTRQAPPRSAGRTKVVSGVVELARDGEHLGVGQAAGVEHHGERVAAELPVGVKTSAVA